MTDLDPTRVEAFSLHLLDTFGKSYVTYMIDLASRTGLLEAAAQGPGTSDEVSRRAGLSERYVRECLSVLASGGIVEYDGSTRTFTLPAEHAVCLTGHTAENMSPLSRLPGLLAKQLDGLEEAFRHGGGVSYEDYRPEFTGYMDELGRAGYDQTLIGGLLPLTGDVPARLTAGARVADIGCGTGHTTNLLAREYPASTFIGYDFAADAIEQARKEAAEYGLTNVTFEVLDVVALNPAEPFDVVFAFDAIHDQAKPATVLQRIFGSLTRGGVFVMVDINASSNLEDNIGNPLAPMIYGISTLHCMTVSLAQGGDGLGTAWGEQLARGMLDDAGFESVETATLAEDPLNLIYVARKP